jgi:regulator of protease activity HflC (stomatin/prohibitin superfamily)
MGLKYNANSLQLMTDTTYGEQVGQGGRFFVGLGVSFLRFEKTMQKITMRTGDSEAETASGATLKSIDARTLDGLPITLALSVQYKFKTAPAELGALYNEYEGAHADFFVRFIRAKVRDTAATYVANAYFTQRQAIASQMLADLRVDFTGRHVTIESLQLLDILIPTALKNAIENTAIANQEIGQAQFDLEATRVSAQTLILQTKQTNKVTVLDARAAAKAAKTTADALALKVNIINNAERTAYGNLKSTLNMTNSDFLKWVWLESIAENQGLKTTLNVDVPVSAKL